MDKESSDDNASPLRISPLFRVAYDWTLCKPLGTISNFKKLKLDVSTVQSITSNLRSRSRSVSPISDYEESPRNSAPFQNLNKKLISRQNALTLFECSSVYPFIYHNNRFECFVCAEPYLELVLLRQHTNDSHTFADIKRMIGRRKTDILKVDVSVLQCTLCSYKPNDLQHLKRHLTEGHMKLMHPELQDNIIPFKIDSGKLDFKCVICNESFLKIWNLMKHMSVHFNNFSCEICGSGFMTLPLFKKHFLRHKSGSYPCEKCSKVFTTSEKLSLHFRVVHLKKSQWKCPICSERFNSYYSKTMHMHKVHDKFTGVHKCETCARTFNLKYHLICHIRKAHLQEKNQQCEVCSQRFFTKDTLKRHMVIHTGEKNHKCDLCGAAFLRRKNLKVHLRIHDAI